MLLILLLNYCYHVLFLLLLLGFTITIIMNITMSNISPKALMILTFEFLKYQLNM